MGFELPIAMQFDMLLNCSDTKALVKYQNDNSNTQYRYVKSH